MTNHYFYLGAQSRADRAKTLLQLPMTARLGVENGELCYRAMAGQWALPITSHSKLDAIAHARAWLEREANTPDPENTL